MNLSAESGSSWSWIVTVHHKRISAAGQTYQYRREVWAVEIKCEYQKQERNGEGIIVRMYIDNDRRCKIILVNKIAVRSASTAISRAKDV